MTLKIWIRLVLVAEKGEILNLQAKKEENLHPSQDLMVKHTGRKNCAHCGKLSTITLMNKLMKM